MPKATVDARNEKALVIEDEPVIARVCARVLAAEGFQVDIAVNGSVARDMVQQNAYGLILSDIRTPEMNGMEFYGYLQESRPELAGTVIFTTGDLLTGKVRTFLEEAGRPFLPKPFTLDELRSAVRENMGVVAQPVCRSEHGTAPARVEYACP